MVAPSTGSVVLVPFRSQTYRSPSFDQRLFLQTLGVIDWILFQITSSSYGDGRVVELRDTDFVSGDLRVTSFARPAKLFTAHKSLLWRKSASSTIRRSSDS
jgi:mRNA interferase MazF